MKIRGTAAHIAEKYTALARDASAAGDSITAENYLQHAEHYNRIIMAAQAQMAANVQQSQEGANGAGGQRHRRPQGMDDGQRMGNEPFGQHGDEMDETGEPMRSAEAVIQHSAGGDAGGRRRRPNGGDSEPEGEPQSRAEDTPDSINV